MASPAVPTLQTACFGPPVDLGSQPRLSPLFLNNSNNSALNISTLSSSTAAFGSSASSVGGGDLNSQSGGIVSPGAATVSLHRSSNPTETFASRVHRTARGIELETRKIAQNMSSSSTRHPRQTNHLNGKIISVPIGEPIKNHRFSESQESAPNLASQLSSPVPVVMRSPDSTFGGGGYSGSAPNSFSIASSSPATSHLRGSLSPTSDLQLGMSLSRDLQGAAGAGMSLSRMSPSLGGGGGSVSLSPHLQNMSLSRSQGGISQTGGVSLSRDLQSVSLSRDLQGVSLSRDAQLQGGVPILGVQLPVSGSAMGSVPMMAGSQATLSRTGSFGRSEMSAAPNNNNNNNYGNVSLAVQRSALESQSSGQAPPVFESQSSGQAPVVESQSRPRRVSMNGLVETVDITPLATRKEYMKATERMLRQEEILKRKREKVAKFARGYSDGLSAFTLGHSELAMSDQSGCENWCRLFCGLEPNAPNVVLLKSQSLKGEGGKKQHKKKKATRC